MCSGKGRIFGPAPALLQVSVLQVSALQAGQRCCGINSSQDFSAVWPLNMPQLNGEGQQTGELS